MDRFYFPFAEYWWFYLVFSLFVLCVLALDLGVFHRKLHEVSFKEATIWTCIWIVFALVFNLLFYQYCYWKFSSLPDDTLVDGVTASSLAKTLSLEFLTGYVVEKSLAIDNIFIFAMIFSYFKILKKHQHIILYWGILGAMFFRGIFIALGSYLMQYEYIVLFFGLLLMITGIKLVFTNNEAKDLSNNLIIRLLNSIFRVYPDQETDRFFLRVNDQIYVTRLFIALIFIEISDIIFAIDSVPAIFALTDEPFIVYTSNIFAILGLRSIYFMVTGSLDKFVYVKYGLACVLVFVGLKMIYLNDLYGGKFPISWSLIIISVFIGGAVFASLIKNRMDGH